MTSRMPSLLLAITMVTSLLALTPSVTGAMEAPTLSGSPAIDGNVEEAEWSAAERFTFNSPRAGTSTIHIGYLDDENQLAIGVVLADDTPETTGSTQDQVEVLVSPDSPVEEETDGDDRKFVIERDGSFQVHLGKNETVGFRTSTEDSGSSSSGADSDVWRYVTTDKGTLWVAEMLIEVGDYAAGQSIAVAVKQVDIDDNADETSKTTSRPSSLDEGKPSTWEKTTLTGRPNTVRLSVEPAQQEAGVGGDVVATLPADADGGRLTVEVDGPGEGGFTPICSFEEADAGPNRCHFAPLATGSWKLEAVWLGDGDYGRSTQEETVTVERPVLDGDTVLETGSLRVSFPAEAEGGIAEWRYLNTLVTARPVGGDTLDLERLDESNSCRSDPVVAIVNDEDAALELTFDPPVRRAALTLTSPSDSFDANIQAYTSTGQLKTEQNLAGSCSQPAFASLGDVEDDVERVLIEYSGADTQEVLDVFFAHPLTSTAPHTTVRADPHPVHAGGLTTLHATAGSPHRLTKAHVSVQMGSTALETRTCNAAPSQVWIDCPVNVEVPSDANRLSVLITSTDRFGKTWSAGHDVDIARDTVPPQGQILPRPMLAGSGAAVAVNASAQDPSGIERIDIRAFDQAGQTLSEETCQPTILTPITSCIMGVSPPDSGTALVEATFEDRAGNTATVGPKPLPVRSTDTDGDGLPDDLELQIGTSPNLADTDDDGLSDGWEVVGVDRNGDGRSELDLQALGADPLIRDIFMEVDWTERGSQSHKLDYHAIQLVRNVLLAQGIRLHVDAHQQGGPFDPARFDHGHAAHRALMDMGRSGIVYHVLAGEVEGPAASDGQAIYLQVPPTSEQNPSKVGAQLLRQLGQHLELGPGGGGPAEGDAGTQVVYTEDYKPNHLSVLNSAYAEGIFVGTVAQDTVQIPTLAGVTMGTIDEQALDEPAGLDIDLGQLFDSLKAGDTQILEEGSITDLTIRYACPDTGPIRWTSALGAIDWNCDGTRSGTGVDVDVNRGAQNSGLGELVSRNDWDGLSFQPSACPQFALMLTEQEDHPASEAAHDQAYPPLGLAPCPLEPRPTLEPESHIWAVTETGVPSGDIEAADRVDNDGDGQVDEGFADTDDDGIVNLIDGCPTVIDVAQEDRDGDNRGDRCSTVPGPVEGLQVVANATFGVRMSWEANETAWGYNVYKISGGNATRLDADLFPSTRSTSFQDSAGDASARYIVKAVGHLGDQSYGEVVTPTQEGPGAGGDGGAGSDGDGQGEEGVPGPGAVLAIMAASLAAMVARRRR